MGVFICWILFSLLVGFIGSGRNIGFFGAFMLSLFLSPIIGAIFALISKDKADELRERQVTAAQQQQAASLKAIEAQKGIPRKSLTDELEGLQKLKDSGHLTDLEYQTAKDKVFATHA